MTVKKAFFFPKYLYSLLSNNQLVALDCSELCTYQLKYYCFREKDLVKSKSRFALLDPMKVKIMVEKGCLSDYLYFLLSNEQLEALDLSKLSHSIIEGLFPKGNGNIENYRGRFDLLDCVGVKHALEKGLIRLYLLSLISVPVFRSIDFSIMETSAIEVIFPPWEIERLKYKYFDNIWGYPVGLSQESLSMKRLNVLLFSMLTKNQAEKLMRKLCSRDFSPKQGFTDVKDLPADLKQDEKETALKVLGLKVGVTPKEVKKARDTLALQYHPDKKGGSTEKIKEINIAYGTLTEK